MVNLEAFRDARDKVYICYKALVELDNLYQKGKAEADGEEHNLPVNFKQQLLNKAKIRIVELKSVVQNMEDSLT